MSPSGYDPMAIQEYAKVYQEKINGNFSGLVSRYSELERYDSKSLGEFNVKYLVVVKRDKIGKLGGMNINYNIDQKRWHKIFETEATAILENADYKPRARYLASSEGEVKINLYSPNKIKISYKDGKNKTLLLADTWFPGWKAWVNSEKVAIEKCEGIFRCVNLKDAEGEAVFSYEPQSFWLGIKISFISALITIIYLVALKKRD